MNIRDPHFHIWDESGDPQSGHDPRQLFAPKEDPVYTIDHYENDIVIEGFDLTGGRPNMFVYIHETPLCFDLSALIMQNLHKYLKI